jgi:hypothetical protein
VDLRQFGDVRKHRPVSGAIVECDENFLIHREARPKFSEIEALRKGFPGTVASLKP